MDNNNLDSLLDDLQSSVGRVNGPGDVQTSGMSNTAFREVSRSVTTQSSGQLPLPSTAREYQIEYLSPANSTTVAEERAASPGVMSSTEYSSGLERHGNSTTAYKTMSYEYKSSSAGNSGLLRDAADTMTQARAISDINHTNVSELDTLLDDLNSAQRAGFSREYHVTSSSSRDGYDPAPAPALSRAQHVSRSSQRSYSSEQRYGSVNRDRQSPSPARHTSLDRGMGPGKSAYTTSRDVTYTTNRTTSPSPVRRDVPPSPSTGRQVVHEVYRYETKGTGGINSSSTSTTRYRDASPPRDRVRPPSPGAGLPDYPMTGVAKVSTLVREYERRASREEQEAAATLVRRSPSPARSPGPGRRKMATSTTTYNYSSTSSGRPSDPPRTPPPHRSPSPVSFPMPPEPLSGSGYAYRRDETSNYSTHRSRSRSPQPQPFPVSRTVHTHHLEREERVHREPPLQPRPFPTPSPTPHEDQRPPKELNELMSSFSETDMSHTSVRQHALDLEQRSQRQAVVPARTPPKSPSTPTPVQEQQVVTRNVAGPPVYYPPGVEMFQHREESMQQSGGGGYKGKAKAKYEYKMKQRSKESSKTGKAVVPVCLPLCCAMPCEIM